MNFKTIDEKFRTFLSTVRKRLRMLLYKPLSEVVQW
jgi:hypothetical protein